MRASYLPAAQYPHLLRTIVDVETARFDFKVKGNGRSKREIVIDSVEAVPAISADARVLIVAADYKRLMRSLKRKERFDSIPLEEVPLGLVRENEETKVVQFNSTTYELIQLCDGSRAINQIAAEFSAAKTLGVSPLKASVYGLASLAKLGFIDILAASN